MKGRVETKKVLWGDGDGWWQVGGRQHVIHPKRKRTWEEEWAQVGRKSSIFAMLGLGYPWDIDPTGENNL